MGGDAEVQQRRGWCISLNGVCGVNGAAASTICAWVTMLDDPSR